MSTPTPFALSPLDLIDKRGHSNGSTALETAFCYVIKVKVEENGVTVPRQMLGDAEEVEIRDENHRIVIEPVRGAKQEGSDPISKLGQDPVSCGAAGASVSYDKHLYGG